MNIYSFFLDIIKYTVSGLSVFFVAFYVLRSHFDNTYKLKLLDFKKSVQGHTLPLRLQAYERMVLFLERINPANMMVRLHVTGISAREMQNIILVEIRSEFQHNITQQLYINERSWNIVKRVKEDTIALINNAVQGLPDTTTGAELSRVIITHLAGLEDDPYEAALEVVKQEMQELF